MNKPFQREKAEVKFFGKYGVSVSYDFNVHVYDYSKRFRVPFFTAQEILLRRIKGGKTRIKK